MRAGLLELEMRITRYRGGASTGTKVHPLPWLILFCATVVVSLLAVTHAFSPEPPIPAQAKAGPTGRKEVTNNIVAVMPAGEAPAPQPPPDRPSWEVQQFLEKPWKGDFADMRKRRIIRALVVYSRTLYFLDGARERGATYEYLRLFEDSINQQLNTGNLRIHVLCVPVNRDELLPGLLEGRGDIAAANLTITDDRIKQVAFSTPVASDVNELVVTGPSAPDLARIEDLAGREVHVRRSSSYFEHLQSLNESFRNQGLPEIRIRPVDEYLESEDILEMVNAGLIPVTVVDSHVAGVWTQVYRNIRVRTDLVVHSGGQIAWAFRKDCPQLKKVADAFIRSHGQRTLIGNMLAKKYFSNVDYIRNNTGSEDLKRYRATIGYFRKYGEQYRFDYLMMAAQGYQESRLNQSLVSRSGAVGVMQVKPSTAADRHVNIRDVYRVDNNIHAGIKYMRFVMDAYFRKEPMDDLNRGLFAVASYNAGPGRIAQLRAIAKQRKLNPNVWFRNVEVVAAREIGRETVQYVSNIFKYYLAYKSIEEKQQLRIASAGS